MILLVHYRTPRVLALGKTRLLGLSVPCALGWRVQGLGVVPGLFCPHYDITEGNGVIRANDFTTMMQRHSGSMLSTLLTHHHHAAALRQHT